MALEGAFLEGVSVMVNHGRGSMIMIFMRDAAAFGCFVRFSCLWLLWLLFSAAPNL